MDREESTDTENESSFTLNRRSYLGLATLAGVPLAGYVGSKETQSDETELDVTQRFGYGGMMYTTSASNQLVSTQDSDIDEPNNTQAEATPITTDSDIPGYLGSDDVDWFAFDLIAGTEIDVTLELGDGISIVALVLYDTDGGFVEQRYISGPTSSLTYTSTETGTHYAQIVAIEVESGSYSVRIDTGAESSPTSTPTATSTPSATSTQTPTETAGDSEFGIQGYGEYGYGGTV